MRSPHTPHVPDSYVRVRGAREHNLQGVDVDIPRDVLTVFTGVSGSGKSSLAFGTIYAEAQRRYFESVAPYARRLIHQVGAPKVGRDHRPAARGLAPAAPLGADLPLLRRHGHQPLQLPADAVLPRRRLPAGRRAARLGRLLPEHGGRAPARSATAWAGSTARPRSPSSPTRRCRSARARSPPGRAPGRARTCATSSTPSGTTWTGRGANCRAEQREWILFTDEQPVVTVHPVRDADRIQRPYQGTYMSARRYVMKTFADSKSPTLRAKAERFLASAPCPVVRRQQAAPRGDGGHLRGPYDRRAGRAAAVGAGRGPASAADSEAARVLTDDLHVPDRARHRAGPRLPQPGPRDPHPLGGRTAAAAAGDPAAVGAVRGGVRPGRAVRRTAPGGHGGAAHGAGPAQGGRATRCSSWSTTSTSCAARTGSWTWGRRPASTAAGAAQRPGGRSWRASASRRRPVSSSTATPAPVREVRAPRGLVEGRPGHPAQPARR